jgi:hypothetical protein
LLSKYCCADRPVCTGGYALANRDHFAVRAHVKTFQLRSGLINPETRRELVLIVTRRETCPLIYNRCLFYGPDLRIQPTGCGARVKLHNSIRLIFTTARTDKFRNEIRPKEIMTDGICEHSRLRRLRPVKPFPFTTRFKLRHGLFVDEERTVVILSILIGTVYLCCETILIIRDENLVELRCKSRDLLGAVLWSLSRGRVARSNLKESSFDVCGCTVAGSRLV